MSKTLIIYATRNGTTARAAGILAEKLAGDAEVVEIGKGGQAELEGYDTVLVGGSIRAGQVHKDVKQLCARHRATLLEKRLGLFLCHMYEGETAQKQFDEAYPAGLREHAAACGLFRGAFDFDKMGFFEKVIVKKVAGVTESMDKLDIDAIEAFARAFD